MRIQWAVPPRRGGLAIAAPLFLSLLLVFALGRSEPAGPTHSELAPGGRAVAAAALETPTPPPCPTGTPQPLLVDPVTSPTDLATQVVTVTLGDGETVTVTAESGVFTAPDPSRFYPIPVTITLLPSTTHHLEVEGRVKRVDIGGGCFAGGYTLRTDRDRDGRPLTIVRQAEVPTPTPTFCPQATPVPLWVEPVTSPTGLLTQTLIVRIGSGEAVTVTGESGTFAATGNFGVDINPALMPVQLYAGVTHHFRVEGKVRASTSGGCPFGGYTLSTDRDRFGNPLIIVQQTGAGTPSATPTRTSTPPGHCAGTYQNFECHVVHVPRIARGAPPGW